MEKGNIHRAPNFRDLQAAHDLDQPTIVQTVEGAQFLERHVDRMVEVYKPGVRHHQLHQQDDMVSPSHLDRLTALGRKVVKEWDRMGILVYVSHARPEIVLDALKVDATAAELKRL